MKKFIIIPVISLLSCLAYSQSLTTVTATITDPSPQAFVSGTATAEYQRPANSQGITPVINGTPIVERPALVGLDGAGTFVLNLANLALVSPAGGRWRFTLCPNASSSCSVVDSAGIIGASVNLSANLSAGVFLISVPAQPHIFRAYKDSEIITAPGVVWLDVTLNVVKYIDALGIIHTLGGGVIGVTVGGGLVLTGSSVGLRVDCGSANGITWTGAVWNCGTFFTGSGTPGKIPKFNTATSLIDSAASDIIAEFTGCSGVLYLAADGTCKNVNSIAFYQTMQRNAIALTQRPIFNFSQRFTAVDNGGATRTDIDANAPGTGNLLATYASDPGASIALAAFDGNKNLTPSTINAPGTNTNVPQRTTTLINQPLVANTQTIVLTETVTFPATGGPYRADSRYGAWITAGPDACAAEVIDTTNTRAFALSAQDGNGGGFIALSASEISTQTYAAGATPTFTLQVQCNVAHSVTANSGLFTFTPAELTYLSVTPVLSQ